MDWYCIRTQPKRENISAISVAQEAEAEVFCPRIRFQRSTRRGLVWFVEALFPGYFFARFDFYSQSRLIAATRGVVGVVQFGGIPAPLPDRTIEALRELVDDETGVAEIAMDFQPGDTVVLTHSSFGPIEAVVQSYRPAKERVKVLIEILGQTVAAETHVSCVVQAGERRAALLCRT